MLNDMRDRLIELISDIENELLRSYPYTTDEYRIASIADHLIENGAIIPPCKVGDTLYSFSFHKIIEAEVIKVEWSCEAENYGKFIREKITLCGNDINETKIDFYDIGKTWFLTREDAEKALREREGE